MKLQFLATLFVCVAATPISNPTPIFYDGYKVLRLPTGRNLKTVKSALSAIELEKWNHDTKNHIDILLAPSQLPAFEALDLDYHIMHADLGASISAESAPTSKWKRNANDSSWDSWWDSYHAYDDHFNFFNRLHDEFAEQSEIISSGTSYEGRDIYGLHLWGKDGPGKPAVLYHGTVHAREWIAAPVVEYITYQLISGYNHGDEEVQSFLNRYDFYILPFVNPDGFIYSQTTDRLWRKNRQPGPANSTCYGRDINRNWAFGWDANDRGASADPCSQTYKGEAPSDTPENKGLDNLVHEIRDNQGIKLFIDWHSYGQYILSPYGYNETLYAPNLGKWTKAAALISDEILLYTFNNTKTTFTFGPSGAVLYTTTGAAPDHVYEVGGAEFSYTIELPDTGDYAFVLPPELIRPSVEEQWVGQKVLLGLLDEEFFDGIGDA